MSEEKLPDGCGCAIIWTILSAIVAAPLGVILVIVLCIPALIIKLFLWNTDFSDIMGFLIAALCWLVPIGAIIALIWLAVGS